METKIMEIKIKSDSYYVIQGEELFSLITRLNDLIDEIKFIAQSKTMTVDSYDGIEGLIFFN